MLGIFNKQFYSKQIAAATGRNNWFWPLPLVYLCGVVLFFVMHYGTNWSENDTNVLTSAIREFSTQADLVPSSAANIYPNGYAYQVLSSLLSGLTGLSAEALQQQLYPLLVPLVVFPAWLFFQELLENKGVALTLATVLLLIQPEFLFVITRSSHEKFSRSLLMLCLYFLLRSFKTRHSLNMLIVNIGLFYLTIFGLATYNNFLSFSLIGAFGLVLVIGWLVAKIQPKLAQPLSGLLPRFGYIVLIGFILTFILTFYVYSPSAYVMATLKEVVLKVGSMFLDLQPATANPYTQVGSAWINLPVYVVLSIANWLTLVASVIIWSRQTWRWVVRGQAVTSQQAFILWLFYSAFMVQGVLAVVIDLSGAFANIQNRIFPTFTMFAVPLVVSVLLEWWPRHVQKQRLALATAFSILVLLGLLAPLKAYNEPIVSNKWIYSTTPELAGVSWSNQYLQNSRIWTDFDERVATVYLTKLGPLSFNNKLDYNVPNPLTRFFMISDVNRQRAERLQKILPISSNDNQLYDNGTVQVYRRHPRLPDQE